MANDPGPLNPTHYVAVLLGGPALIMIAVAAAANWVWSTAEFGQARVALVATLGAAGLATLLTLAVMIGRTYFACALKLGDAERYLLIRDAQVQAAMIWATAFIAMVIAAAFLHFSMRCATCCPVSDPRCPPPPQLVQCSIGAPSHDIVTERRLPISACSLGA